LANELAHRPCDLDLELGQNVRIQNETIKYKTGFGIRCVGHFSFTHIGFGLYGFGHFDFGHFSFLHIGFGHFDFGHFALGPLVGLVKESLENGDHENDWHHEHGDHGHEEGKRGEHHEEEDDGEDERDDGGAGDAAHLGPILEIRFGRNLRTKKSLLKF
jgi:hypothetical protein